MHIEQKLLNASKKVSITTLNKNASKIIFTLANCEEREREGEKGKTLFCISLIKFIAQQHE